ncbi:hypothetical protein SAMN02799630_04505 [Paenibacillus sp. UNCCL117]|uniref:hypothetical protein n=1 Tax=unclassified Paenibacillus TaxID=185978 RepID=UPI000887BB87|nr:MULTISPECIES: hypothetical protein [unclassified Paenibacillus]SDE04650.1 hypothetical protein SAMN04488602_117114 [Paenibacillus sp. cl123]SFW57698.1 hypothetical protein SAMN02799630_04505 [Paenibacillus sp. UNCCL117]
MKKKIAALLASSMLLFGVPSVFAQVGFGDTYATAVPLGIGGGYSTTLQFNDSDITVYTNLSGTSTSLTANLQSPSDANYDFWVEVHQPGGSITYYNPTDLGTGGTDSVSLSVGPGSKAYFVVHGYGSFSSSSYTFWLQ